MNTVVSKTSLATIRADIARWIAERTTKRGGACADDPYYCCDCGEIIQQTTLYASVHDSLFGDRCAGRGEVINLSLPFCPHCEPGVTGRTNRTCIHEEVV